MTIIGAESSMPIVRPRAEILETRIGLAEKFAEDARRPVEDAEGAGDEARAAAARPSGRAHEG